MEIYHVQADEGDRCITLGYATGRIEDIKQYYDDRKIYGLHITPINVVHIDSNSAKERANLIEEQKRIQSRLNEINSQLRR